MMNEVESRASDESILWFVFERHQPEGQTNHAAAIELVEAVSEFLEGWIAPLTVGVRVKSSDPANAFLTDDANPPALPAWFLRRRQLDERLLIGPSWIDSQEHQVDSIGAAELSSLLEEALVQPPPLPNREVTLAELLISAAEVALPAGLQPKIVVGGKPLTLVLIRSGERWLAQGPDYNFIGPPVAIRASNDYGTAKIVVEFFWGFWADHPAGLAQVRAAIERVLGRGRGWQITEGNLPA